MSGTSDQPIRELGENFTVKGDFSEGTIITTGLINPTYLASYQQAEDNKKKRYIFQNINAQVFPDPLMVMRNVQKVTEHLQKKKHGRSLTLVPTHKGTSYFQDKQGQIWRCYHFLENCKTYDTVENPNQAYQAGWAFGEFQKHLRDFPAEQLEETIPSFHDTPQCYQTLRKAIQKDPLNRVQKVKEEINFIQKREHTINKIQKLIKTGQLPLRVTHNDSKLNNVMLDAVNGKAVCVIDLDTVMPGSLLYDFGDLVRTVTSQAEEDEPDLSQVHMRLPYFEAVLNGFISGAGQDSLTPLEIELLPEAGALITLELAIRFLTDYLLGDHYFRCNHPEHNLDRCRNQLALLHSIEQQMSAMKDCVKTIT